MSKRLQEKQARIAAAEAARLPVASDVLVLGGGAAGLSAAIAAAEAGAKVLVLEAAPEAGHSILKTGNGRCNFYPASLDVAHYNHPAFVETALTEAQTLPLLAGTVPSKTAGNRSVGSNLKHSSPKHSVDENSKRSADSSSERSPILRFFSDAGLAWIAKGDKLFPQSLQARSVRQVLLNRLKKAGGYICAARTVSSITRVDGGWKLRVFPDDARILTSALILATGSSIDGVLGDFLQEQRIFYQPFEPLLCPLLVQPQLASLDGFRIPAEVSLYRAIVQDSDAKTSQKQDYIAREYGEVQFRRNALSGIVIFNMSRRAHAEDRLSLNLCPRFSEDELSAYLMRHQSAAGLIDPDFLDALKLTTQDPPTLAKQLQHLTFEVVGHTFVNQAQVKRGGIAITELSGKTLELHQHPGLFVAGELVDIDGDCGGYNLAWAWLSGLLAGTAAARHVYNHSRGYRNQ